MEFLKEVLGDELFAQVSEKLNGNESIRLANIADGKYIPKEKFDAERTGAKALKSQIDELNNRIVALQGENSGVNELKAQLAQIQSDLAAKDEQIKNQRMDFSIMDAARTHKAKDPELVAQMVDRSQIVEQDDSFIGINEQMEALVKTYAYMFDTAPAPSGGFDPNRIPSGTPSENSFMNNMIRSAANH